jgi:peptide methionine sulfoxide reductase MsrA
MTENEAGHFYTAEDYLQNYYKKHKKDEFYRSSVLEKLDIIKNKSYFLSEPLENDK